MGDTKMRSAISAAVVAACLVSGCATKRYGRLAPLTGAERVAYNCRDIDLEIAKVEAFKAQVAEGARFNVASVLGILGDYGIGNSMERHEADASAARRLTQLTDLKFERGCASSSLSAVDRQAAVASVSNSQTATLSADPADPPGTINLGGGVKLAPAKTLSGYCIKAPTGYAGTGAANRPSITNARPICGSSGAD
jgi:hypothetical protein